MLIKALDYISLFIFSLLTNTVSNQNFQSNTACQTDSGFCFKDNFDLKKDKYLFYDVNNVEGFNLRRDVYIRVANLVKKINSETDEFKLVLVLPPWDNLRHWKSEKLDQSKLDWSLFFNVTNLGEYVPVIELSKLLKSIGGNIKLDKILYLKTNYDNIENEGFNKMKILEDCDGTPYFKMGSEIRGHFWGYSDRVVGKTCQIVSFRGTNYFFAKHLIETFSKPDTNFLMIDQAESMVHQNYGQAEYWQCRKSMQMSNKLVQKALEFRSIHLNSKDSIEKNYHRKNMIRYKNLGGDYIGIHVRRGDFLRYRKSITLKHSAKQIKHILDKLNLTKVFIATDGTSQEINELKDHLKDYQVYNFNPSEDELSNFKDGGISMIDQLICAYSKFFIGSKESTFSLRIQEEREILGFDETTTFNCLCDEETICHTSKWLINFD